MGHRLTTQDLLPESDKVIAVREFPIPANTRQLKGLLGLDSFYRRFIPNFSKTAKPLTELLRWNTHFMWKKNEAFITLKDLLTSELLLQYSDFTQLFVFITDASNEA